MRKWLRRLWQYLRTRGRGDAYSLAAEWAKTHQEPPQ